MDRRNCTQAVLQDLAETLHVDNRELVNRLPPSALLIQRKARPRMKVLTSLFLMSYVTIVVSPVTFAQPAVERTTLMLNGASCESSRQNIKTAIKELPGVWKVDGYSIPDHLLIDVEKGPTAADHLARKVVELSAAQSPCRISIMQSCISH